MKSSTTFDEVLPQPRLVRSIELCFSLSRMKTRWGAFCIWWNREYIRIHTHINTTAASASSACVSEWVIYIQLYRFIDANQRHVYDIITHSYITEQRARARKAATAAHIFFFFISVLLSPLILLLLLIRNSIVCACDTLLCMYVRISVAHSCSIPSVSLCMCVRVCSCVSFTKWMPFLLLQQFEITEFGDPFITQCFNTYIDEYSVATYDFAVAQTKKKKFDAYIHNT